MDIPTDASARVVRVDKPIASPGSCVICGKSEHPLGFATANLDFEFYGTVYYCADCVGDHARLFGYLSPDDFVALREHIDAQNAELNTLRQSVSSLESTVDSLTNELTRRSGNAVLPVDTTVGANDLVSSPVDEPDAGLSVQDTTGTDNAPNTTESDSSKHVDESGRDDVYDSSTADELLGI